MKASARHSDVLRHDHRVVGAQRIDAVLDGHHPALSAITERMRRLAHDPLTLVVMGEFNAGKSSFINRLLGTDALPVAIVPKTATVTRLVRGTAETVGRVELDRRTEAGEITEVVTHEAFVGMQKAAKIHDPAIAEAISGVREVRVFIDDPLLDSLQLVDTPGFNHDHAMDELTIGILDAADLVIWISDAMQAARQTEFEKLRLLKERGKRIWLVVNKADVNVADESDWTANRNALISHLKENGFLDFFETSALHFVSCKQDDHFWAKRFEELKNSLRYDIFSQGTVWSSRLIGEALHQLGCALREEATRFGELTRCMAALGALSDVESEAQLHGPVLVEALRGEIAGLDEAILEHAGEVQASAASGGPVLTAFTMDYTRGPLLAAFERLVMAYRAALQERTAGHLTEVIGYLQAITSHLTADDHELRREAQALGDYFSLLRNNWHESKSLDNNTILPAVACTVEMIDHLRVQSDKPFNWRFCLDVETGDLPNANTLAHPLHLFDYGIMQMRQALIRDFRHDLVPIVSDPAIRGLLSRLETLCSGSVARLDRALQIESDHNATSPGTDRV